MRMCEIDGCDQPHVARGWCKTHYYRWRRNGDPLTGRAPAGYCLTFLNDAVASETDECIEWPFWKYSNGYAGITLNGIKRVASRVVCELAHGSPPHPSYQSAHSCNNRACINPRHLRWATISENHADKVGHGTTNRGERHGAAVLTEPQVIWARAAYAKGGVTYQELADAIGVKWGTLAAAISGKNWAFVEPPPKPKQEAMF